MKRILNWFLISFFLITGFSEVLASHIIGAQITYISKGKNVYEFTVDVFRDCRGIPLDSQGITIEIQCIKGSASSIKPSYSRKSIVDITPVCAQVGKKCSPINEIISSSTPAIEKHTFVFSYDFSTFIKNGCCQIQIGAGQCCRNTYITTGGSGQDFWVFSMLDLCLGKDNNSPQFVSEPISILKCGLPQYLNVSAIDYIDQDSLVYELVDPMTSRSGKMSWKSGFDAQNPFTVYCKGSCTPGPKFSPPRGFYLNKSNGDLVFTPTNCNETTVTSIRIYDYRKDSKGKYNLMGYVTRDWQSYVVNMPNNYAPNFTGANDLYFADSVKNSYVITTIDQPYVPPIGKTVNNDTVSLSLQNKILSQFKNGNFKIIDSSAKHPSGIFEWQPSGVQSKKSKLLIFEARDNACDFNAITQKSFNVFVRKQTELAWVEGNTFYDINRNCKRDSTERTIPNMAISANGGKSSVFIADSNGYFSGWVPTDSSDFMIIGPFGSYACVKSFKPVYGKKYFLELAGLPSMKISGTVYEDTIKDCKVNSLEPRLKNRFIYTEPGDFTSSTDSAGRYLLDIPGGEYKIRIQGRKNLSHIRCPSAPHEVSIFTDTVFSQKDIAVYDSGTVKNAAAYILTSSNYRRGFKSIATVVVKNLGTLPFSSSVILKFDKRLKYSSSSKYLSKTDSTITWSLKNIGLDRELNFYVFFNADIATCKLDDTMSMRVFLDTSGLSNDADLTDNYQIKKIKIVAAVDPNIKEEQNTNGYAWREGNKLNYFIQFQNTGTDTAVNIRLEDTLHFALLARTIDIQGASHNYNFSIQNNVLKVYFPNIYLPDTAASKENSIGHMAFSIDIDPRLDHEIKFPNKAAIYFDFAKAVETNKKYITYTSLVKAGKTNQKVYCTSDTLKIDYTSNFEFNKGNDFKLILSDTSGVFTNSNTILDTIVSEDPNGTFKTILPSSLAFSNHYRLKVISTNPSGTIFEDAFSNTFTIYPFVKPQLLSKDTFYCSDSVTLNLKSKYDGFTIYDRHQKMDSIGSLKSFKLKFNPGKHYLTASTNITTNCRLVSDTLLFVSDTLPVVTFSSISHPKLTVCDDDTIQLKISGVSTFDLLDDTLGYINNYHSSSIKLVLINALSKRTIRGYNQSGCNALSNTLNLVRANNPSIILNISDKDLVICKKDILTFSGSGGHSYQLYKNDTAFLSGFTGYVQSNFLNNQDRFKLLGTDSNLCFNWSKSDTLKVNDLPNVKISAIDTSLFACEFDSIGINLSGGVSYNMFINNIYYTKTSSNVIWLNMLNDKDVVHVEGTNSNACVDVSNKLQFTIHRPSMKISLVNTGGMCKTDTVRLKFNGGVMYDLIKNGKFYKTINTQTYNSRDFKEKDNVYVKGTDVYGCKTTSNSLTFSFLASPVIWLVNNDVDDSHCHGDKLNLSLSGSNKFDLYKNEVLWKTSQGSNPIFKSDLINGDVLSAVGYNSIGCHDTSNKIKFVVFPLPKAMIEIEKGNDTICEGTAVQLKLSGGVSYKSYKNNSLYKSGPLDSLNLLDLKNMDKIFMIATDANTCIDTSLVLNFTVNTLPSIQMNVSKGNKMMCKGDEVILSLNGGDGYNIYYNNAFWRSVTYDTLQLNNLNNYDSIFIIGYSTGNCLDTTEVIKFEVFDAPKTKLENISGSDTFCRGDLLNLRQTGALRYDVFKNGQLLLSTANDSIQFLDFNSNDTFFSIGYLSKCSQKSNELILTVIELPIINISSEPVKTNYCEGDVLKLKLLGEDGFDIYRNNKLWRSTNKDTVFINDIQNREIVYSIAQNKDGCYDTSNILEYSVWTRPVKPVITKIGKTLFSNYSFGNQWYEESVKIGGAIGKSYNPSRQTKFHVTHTDSNGCVSLKSDPYEFNLAIASVGLSGLKVYPNPANDFITIETSESSKYSLQLLDISGRMVTEVEFFGNEFKWSIKPAKGIYLLKINNQSMHQAVRMLEFN